MDVLIVSKFGLCFVIQKFIKTNVRKQSTNIEKTTVIVHDGQETNFGKHEKTKKLYINKFKYQSEKNYKSFNFTQINMRHIIFIKNKYSQSIVLSANKRSTYKHSDLKKKT